MKYGFIKVCSATVKLQVADVKFNAQQIIKAYKESYENGSQLTVFPELCLSGYTCGDLFNQRMLSDAVKEAVKEIVNLSKGVKTLAFIGAPVEKDGKLYNCAIAFSDGKLLGIVPKINLPNYGEFYELRHFSKAPTENEIISYAGFEAPFGSKILFKAKGVDDFVVSAEICEDLWVPDSPSVKHVKAGATIIANLSCSDETVGKAEYRRSLVKMQSAKLVCGYVYTDSGDGESTTDLVFAGHNIISENGTVLAESNLFENGLVYSEIDTELIVNERKRLAGGFFDNCDIGGYDTVEFETDNSGTELLRKYPQKPFVPCEGDKLSKRAELILSIQSKALEKRLLHTGAKTAVIGISGGLDSALAFLVTVRAFKSICKNAKDIIAITMPGFGTTPKTKNNSLKLIELLGATSKTIDITPSVKQHFKDIGHNLSDFDSTYENAQARMRTMILMDIANQTGGLVIGTGDLSELALGWATYNGDHMSMYGVNCSVPKTLVKFLVSYEADKLGGELKNVLYDIVNTEISPELLPASDGEITQKTEDIVGPYLLHDFFLYFAIRYGFKPEKVRFLAEITFSDIYDKKTIDKWLKNFYQRFFSQQFKRSCVPDGVKVGSVSLSPRGDWRMPSDAVAKLWIDNLN